MYHRFIEHTLPFEMDSNSTTATKTQSIYPKYIDKNAYLHVPKEACSIHFIYERTLSYLTDRGKRTK